MGGINLVDSRGKTLGVVRYWGPGWKAEHKSSGDGEVFGRVRRAKEWLEERCQRKG